MTKSTHESNQYGPRVHGPFWRSWCPTRAPYDTFLLRPGVCRRARTRLGRDARIRIFPGHAHSRVGQQSVPRGSVPQVHGARRIDRRQPLPIGTELHVAHRLVSWQNPQRAMCFHIHQLDRLLITGNGQSTAISVPRAGHGCFTHRDHINDLTGICVQQTQLLVRPRSGEVRIVRGPRHRAHHVLVGCENLESRDPSQHPTRGSFRLR